MDFIQTVQKLSLAFHIGIQKGKIQTKNLFKKL